MVRICQNNQSDDLKNGDCVYVDLNNDGKIDSNDMSRQFGFTDDPEYMAGLNMGFSWKGLMFNAMDCRMECKPQYIKCIPPTFYRPYKLRSRRFVGIYVRSYMDSRESESKCGISACDIINDTNNYAESTLWEKDAKYLRLKNLQIAYNFNLPFMKKLKLNTMQLALSGYNLLTFTPYFWSDPESKASNSPSYPLTKTYSLSLKLGF